MRRFTVSIGLTLALLGLLLSASSCTFMLSSSHRHGGGPPPHAQAHGRRYSYIYYPSCYVYFDIGRKVYFYLEGATWRMCVSLPSSIRIVSSEGVSIVMDTNMPYAHFGKHKEKYPPGQIKKKKQPVKQVKEKKAANKRKALLKNQMSQAYQLTLSICPEVFLERL